MGTANFVVDTNPMAASVESVSQRLNVTAAAVVAMQNAVIQSEKEAADVICQNVDRGFFSLMQSQIMTKKAQHYSNMNSSLMLLMELSKSLDTKGERMENDVARLHRQYYKIFHSIDQALDNRIRQVNKDATTISDNRNELITTRALKDLGTVLTSDRELSRTEQQSLVARIKNKTKRALMNISNDVDENEEYKDQIENLVDARYVQNPNQECVPVLVVQEDSMVMQDSKVCRVVAPEEMKDSCKAVVENQIRQNVDAILSVQKSDEENSEIMREYIKLLNTSNLNPRVADVMMEMFKRGGR